jgi:hypothetical protein
MAIPCSDSKGVKNDRTNMVGAVDGADGTIH